MRETEKEGKRRGKTREKKRERKKKRIGTTGNNGKLRGMGN